VELQGIVQTSSTFHWRCRKGMKMIPGKNYNTKDKRLRKGSKDRASVFCPSGKYHSCDLMRQGRGSLSAEAVQAADRYGGFIVRKRRKKVRTGPF